MNFVRLIPVILSSVLMVAHFSRANQDGLVIVCLFLPFLLFIKRRWVAKVFQVLLLFGSIEWIQTALRLVHTRQAHGQAWERLAIILGSVVLFTVLSALVFESRSLKQRFQDQGKSENVLAAVFLLTALLLSMVEIKINRPIILLERLFPTMGWIEISLLVLYARWIAEKMLDPFQSVHWRQRIWMFFSIVFFPINSWLDRLRKISHDGQASYSSPYHDCCRSSLSWRTIFHVDIIYHHNSAHRSRLVPPSLL